MEIVMQDMRFSQKGLISKIYKIVLVQAMQKLVLYQILWNQDCGNRLQFADWEEVWSSYGFKSYIVNIKFQTSKTAACWHYTPDKLCKNESNKV